MGRRAAAEDDTAQEFRRWMNQPLSVYYHVGCGTVIAPEV
jgi:hypothetical protein